MNNNEFMQDINECTSRGVCSIPPNIAALYELILYFLEQASFYLLKLEENGMTNDKINFEIIDNISGLASINEYGEEQLYNIAVRNYYILTHVKETYNNIQQDNIVNLESKTDFCQNSPLHKAIASGEKLILENSKISQDKKLLIEILIAVIKSSARNLSKLNKYCEFNNQIYISILKSLNFINNIKNSTTQNITEEINTQAKLDNTLKLNICRYLFKNFGQITKTKVSLSTIPGKSILISGNNFNILEEILKITKDTGINIYTHSNLIMAHAFSKFKEYKNLIGHYGNCGNANILDFATFPGAILLTGNTTNTTEYLYRGRIFSNDNIRHKGVIKIENEDYTPLIDAALNSKGFSKGKIKNNIVIGYDENKLEQEFDKIINKLNNNDIKKLYIIGANTLSEIQKEYFKIFFNNIKSNEYVINFSNELCGKNILSINIEDPLATHILHDLFMKYKINNKIVFIFTSCDVSTLSGIITLKNNRAKNIYISSCSPTQINPSIFDVFKNKYNIKFTTTPDKDLLEMRNTKRPL